MMILDVLLQNRRQEPSLQLAPRRERFLRTPGSPHRLPRDRLGVKAPWCVNLSILRGSGFRVSNGCRFTVYGKPRKTFQGLGSTGN